MRSLDRVELMKWSGIREVWFVFLEYLASVVHVGVDYQFISSMARGDSITMYQDIYMVDNPETRLMGAKFSVVESVDNNPESDSPIENEKLFKFFSPITI
jgi:hypothetical protein